MELLETALKHSINQCLQEKHSKFSHTSGLTETIEVNLKEESRARAFITQFKIELNNLMGLKRVEGDGKFDVNSEEETDEEDDGNSLNHSFEENEDTLIAQTIAELGGPIIKLNGRHSGLYKISEHDNKPASDSTQNSIETDVDDGYKSMNQSNFKNSIIHQLNEIKSRLIDLVHEIDEKVESRLSNMELNLYRRRRNVIVEKLDFLLDTLSGKASDTSQYSLPNSILSSDATSSQLSSEHVRKSSDDFLLHYEEQEQTIDYNDSSNSSLEDDCNLGTQSKQTEDNLIYSRALLIDKGKECLTNGQDSLKEPVKCSSFNKQQHIPSSSTTSTYSTSSHTSSSSFL